ncbi:unnamed protein product, partial [Mesorhabditis belari]|uniref:Uncharacterized protein n=1 Tax=Mesorhabditis belari TaxID=2138241 RepID=A0AAF3J521_9BILA
MKGLALIAFTVLCTVYGDPTDVFTHKSPSEPFYVVDGQSGPTLECAIKETYRDRESHEVSWTLYSHGHIRHISRSSKLLSKEYFDLVEDAKTGNYNLKIKKVARGLTEGKFQCSVLNLESGEQYTADSLEVVMLVEPGPPEIVDYPSQPVKEGDGIQMKCRTEGGSPPPTIQWLFDNKTVANQDLYSVSVKDEVVESRIQWRARAEDNGAFLTCMVSNKALEGRAPKAVQSPRLNVLYKPTVTVGPVPDYIVEEDQQIELTCSGQGNPQPTGFEWKHIQTGERYLDAKWPLKAERKYAGEFECRASNTIGESVDKMKLDVQYKPRVTTKDMVNPSEGDTVSIDCTIDANPKAEGIEWVGPNGFTSKGPKIVLPSISRDQSGDYICRATNYLTLYGQTGAQPRTGQSTVKVDVRRKPGSARITPSTLNVPVGGTIQLTCVAMDPGSPTAEYKWASPSSGGQYGTMDHNGEILTIRNAQLSDNGEYKCLPFNRIGEGEVATVKVIVVEPAEISKPLATERVYNTGETTTGLECEAQGYPTPDIAWLRDGQPVDPLRFSIKTKEGRENCPPGDYCTKSITSTLAFQYPVEWCDKGNYTCAAQNGGGEAAKTWSIVRVVHSPQILNDVYNGESLAAVDLETTARISCRVSARPEPTFKWFKDSVEIEEGERFAISANRLSSRPDEFESVLSFTDATKADYGKYMCRATNGKGPKAEVVILLKEKSKPEPPQQIQTVSTSPTSLNIAWKRGFDGGYSQTFILEYKRINPFTEKVADEEAVTTIEVKNLQRIEVRNKDSNRAKRSPTMTSLVAYNLTGLLPQSTYYIKLKAKNEIGTSDFSSPIVSTTGDIYEDPTFETPIGVKYNTRTMGLTLEPQPSSEICVQLYVSFGEFYRGVGCWPVDREISDLPGGAQFRIRYCSRTNPLHCSSLSREVISPSPFTSKWRFLVPVLIALIALAFFCIILTICCRSRRGKDDKKKNKRVDIRPEVSGPMPPIEAKNTVTHGSATDSGVFTLENGQKGHHDSYNTQTFSANETIAERDSWPSGGAPASHHNTAYDPFHNDPYLNEYDGGAWRTSVHDGSGGSGNENQTTTTHSDGGDSDSEAFGGQGRVIREIIV